MKKEFRKKCAGIRKNLEVKDLSDKILNLPEYKNADTVFIYISFASEVNTHSLIKKALSEKTVLVPYCLDDNGSMIAVKITDLSDLKEGRFGILEPVNTREYKEKIDLCIVPGLAFSKEGYRMGYGKGYYDRFLCARDTFKVGLTYDELLFDTIPFDSYDVKMNMIITPNKEIKL